MSNPFGTPSQATTSPFSTPSQATTSPFSTLSQATPSPFSTQSQVTTSPFSTQSQATPSPFSTQSQTTMSAFGAGNNSSTSSPFSTLSGFGQPRSASQPFGLSPSTGASTMAGSAFGSSGLFQNATSPFNQVSGSSTFGSNFGQTAMSSPSLFGKPTTQASTISQPGQFSGFSQSSQNVGSAGFGVSQPKTTPSPLFGKPSGTNVGQSSGQLGISSGSSVTSPTTAPSLFGKTLSSPSSTTSQAPFSSFPPTNPTNVFGKSSNTTFQGSVSQTGLFGKPVPTAFSAPSTTVAALFGKAPAPLFGKPPEQQKASSPSTSSSFFNRTSSGIGSSGIEPPKLFGKPVQPATSGTFGGLFGQGANSETASSVSAGNSSLTSAGTSSVLFGKGEGKPVIKNENGTADVKTCIKNESGSTDAKPFSSSASFGIKTETGSTQIKSESSTGLLQLKTESKASGASNKYGGLFGKGTGSGSSTQGQSAALFGSVKEERNDFQSSGPKTGRSRQPGEAGEEKGADRSQGASRQTGLFGKPATTTDRTTGSFQSPVARGLFGKTDTKVVGQSDKSRNWKRSEVSRLSSTGSDDGSQGSLFRRQLSEDLNSKVAIVCRNVPSRINNARALREHFKPYGEVAKVFPNPTKGQATIHFKTHEEAAEAKRRGRHLGQGFKPLTIFWSNYTGPSSSAKPSSAERQPSRPVKRFSDALMPSSKRTLLPRDTEVKEELAGMAGTRELNKARQPSPQPGPSGSSTTTLSPEKQSRTISPTPPDVKVEKITASMFEGVVARNTTERLHLLNLRDKYIRHHRRKKDTDISTAKAFVGTCVDMCPERERYDREDKRRLSIYEILPGTENIPGKNPVVDHSRAVKEYIRSSPDQDEPLPHELRPLPVLVKTMRFLLSEVANQGRDGYWADWFDYLWNRTRGIRKDITQQQLCDRDTVALIEKCARFHVYCSERLCEEDMHAFDAKINNENLTKCLQTLKELYGDLEKKQRCFCPHEAEFRAYTVLMNLNQGDILRQVQQLRPAVRTSQEIQFSMQVYFSLNNNNYIRFFRLVKQASFGQACIMHRYFTQVRNRALCTMMRGYRMGSRPAQVRLSCLVRQLGFEDESEAREFCEHYGFNVVDRHVVLDHREYLEPDTAWPARRAPTLIEAKLMVSIGEMINGEAFEDVEMVTPSTSFADDGRFKSLIPLPPRAQAASAGPSSRFQEARHLDTQGVKREPAIKQAETVAVPVAQQPQKPSISSEHVKDAAKMLFWGVIDEMVADISQEAMRDVKFKLDFSAEFTDSLVLSLLSDEMQAVCQDVYEEEQARHQLALRQEREARKDRVAILLTDDIIDDLVHQEVLNLATIEIRDVKAILKQQCIERVTVEIRDDMVAEVFSSLVQEVSEDVYDTDVTQRLQELADLEGVVCLSRAGRFWRRWKKEYKAITKLKRAMQEFPSAANMEDAAGQVRRLIHVEPEKRVIRDKRFYVDDRARLTLESPMEQIKRARFLEAQFTVHELYQRLLKTSAWQPLNLGRLAGRILARKALSRPKQAGTGVVQWKLLLCLPEEEQDGGQSLEAQSTSLFCEWLTAKLSRGKTPTLYDHSQSRLLSLYQCQADGTSSNLPGAYKPGTSQLGVCVRTVSGTLLGEEAAVVEEERLLLGTVGLLFVLPPGAPLCQPDDPYWRKHIVRLQSTLAVRPMCRELPLIVVLPAPASQKSLCNKVMSCLSVGTLIKKGCLSDVKVVVIPTDARHEKGINVTAPECSERLCEGLQWLAGQWKAPPPLVVNSMRDLVESALLEFYYTPTQQNLAQRRRLGHLDQDPRSLLWLYNSMVDHLVDTLTCSQLTLVSWPVPEFSRMSQGCPPTHWNSLDQLEYLDSWLASLRLPEFSPLDPESEVWADVKRDVWMYVSKVTGRSHSPARVTLFSRLKRLLRTVEEDFEEKCFLLAGEDNCEPTYINVPWSRFISLCIDYRLATADFVDPVLAASGAEGARVELTVAYDEDQLQSYLPSPKWSRLEPEKTVLETPSFDATVQLAAFKAKEKKPAAEKVDVQIVEDPLSVSDAYEKARKTAGSLVKSMQLERRSSDHFEKYLENLIKQGEADDISFHPSNSSLHSVLPRDTSVDFSIMDNPKGFDATGYFNQSRNDFSQIFDSSITHDSSALRRSTGGHFSDMTDMKSSSFSGRRVSDVADNPQDISQLFGRRRSARLSEMFGNDPVALSLWQPSLEEEVSQLKDQLRASRRDSDAFERRLRALINNSPMDLN